MAAPSYLSGEMSFGQLMVIVGAFNQVQSSLRWFVDNFSSLADWRATKRRVASFHRATASMDSLGQSTHRIELEETQREAIRIDDLCIAAPQGSVRHWDRRLNEGEKQSLAFARVLLQRPHWLVMDGGSSRANCIW